MKIVRIKICGITRVEDAEAAVDLGADFIGLNFWSKSPRRLEAVRGREIAEAVRGRTSLVGVFVNQAQPEVEKIATTVGFDLIQFHGDETPEDLVPWGERAMKAVRFSG
ncbi:MAG: N-(5'-phosphoribosyl)anthranilate isomerase, partial [bacterium]|nr:N-(5'-phosphoribosyl)anthranilate isomerase [bacterium]